MRNLFFWRLPPSEADFSRLWEDATFVFDTNFLLDLYRVSHSTAANFLKILQQIKNRIWLPYQVADEFLRRREDIKMENYKKLIHQQAIMSQPLRQYSIDLKRKPKKANLNLNPKDAHLQRNVTKAISKIQTSRTTYFNYHS